MAAHAVKRSRRIGDCASRARPVETEHRVARVTPLILPADVCDQCLRALDLDFEGRNQRIFRVHDDVAGLSLQLKTNGKLQLHSSLSLLSLQLPRCSFDRLVGKREQGRERHMDQTRTPAWNGPRTGPAICYIGRENASGRACGGDIREPNPLAARAVFRLSSSPSVCAAAPPSPGRRRTRAAPPSFGGASRRARCRGGHGQARVDLGEAPMTRDVSASADDAIGQCDARFSAGELAHLEAGARLAAHIEAAAVALGRDEHVIAGGPDRLREIAIELHCRASVPELRHAEVLEPVLRALHAVEHALRAVWERHHGVLHIRRERAIDDDVTGEKRLQQAKVS